MRLKGNQRDVIQEELDNALGRIGVPLVLRHDLKAKFFGVIQTLPPQTSMGVFDKRFFDLARSLRIYARQESLSPEQALHSAIKNPRIFFEVMDLFEAIDETQPENDNAPATVFKKEYSDLGPDFVIDLGRKKPFGNIYVVGPVPMTLRQIGSMLYNNKITYEKYLRPGNEGLPEGSVSWAGLREALKGYDLTPKIVARMSDEHSASQAAPKEHARTTYPSDEEIAHAMIRHDALQGRLPPANGREALPEGSHGWTAIYRHIAKRGFGFTSFYNNYLEEKCRETGKDRDTIIREVLEKANITPAMVQALKDERAEARTKRLSETASKLILPDDKTLADASYAVLQETGSLKDRKKIKLNLPENSLSVDRIVLKLRIRKTTLKKLVLQYYPDAFERLETHKNHSKQREVMPLAARKVVAEAAYKIKMAIGRLPNASNKSEGLPEGSPSWTTIISRYREAGTSLGKVVKEFYPDAPPPRARSKKPIPPDAVLAKTAYAIKVATGGLPNFRNKNEGLPEGSAGWGIIIATLRERGTTLRKIVQEFYPDAFKKAKKAKTAPKNLKFMPPDDVIAGAGYKVKISTGKLATASSKHAKLPEGSFGWSHILYKHLPSRGITLAQIVQKYHPDAFDRPKKEAVPGAKKPLPPNAVIAQAAYRIKQKSRCLPNSKNKYEELPDGSPGWATIIAGLRERGTTLKKIVHEFYPEAQTRRVLRRTSKPPFLLDDIEDSARATLSATGRRPSSTDGLIKHGKLADGKTTWTSVQVAFVKKTRGLQDSGYSSIANFLDKKEIFAPESRREKFAAAAKSDVSMNGHAHPLELPAPAPEAEQIPEGMICAKAVFRDAAQYAIQGIVPKSGAEQCTIAGLSVAEANEALRTGHVHGWQQFTPREEEPPPYVIFFMEAAGLLERDGRKLVPAAASRIQALLEEFKL